MSNEPIYKGPMVRPSASQPQTDTPADVAVLLAAIERMEAAVRERSNTIDLFRHDLGEMATLLQDAWGKLDADGRLGDAAKLLHGLAARVERMMTFARQVEDTQVTAALAAAAPVAAAAAQAAASSVEKAAEPTDEEIAFIDAMSDAPVDQEADEVPTVSSVVAQLRGEGEAEPVDAGETAETSRSGTTVAMLEAMVEELAASMPVAQPAEKPSQAVAPPDDVIAALGDATPASMTEPELPEAVLVMPPPDEPPPIEEAAQSEPESEPPAAIAQPQAPAIGSAIGPALEWNLDAIAPAPPREAVMPEIELPNRMVRWESAPYLNQEIGTAVIFESNPESEAPPAADAAPDAAAAPSDDSDPVDVDLDALLFEPAPEPEADPAAFLLEPVPGDEAVPRPPATTATPPETPKDLVPEPQAEAPPPPSTIWEIDPPAPAALASGLAKMPPAPAAPEPPAEPADPAWAFEPPAPAAPAMPQRTPSQRARDLRQYDERNNDERDNDPLAPLKAMSDEELIALFE